MGSRKNGYGAFCPRQLFHRARAPPSTQNKIHLLRAAKRCLVMPARREIRRTVGPQPALDILLAELALQELHEPRIATRPWVARFPLTITHLAARQHG